MNEQFTYTFDFYLKLFMPADAETIKMREICRVFNFTIFFLYIYYKKAIYRNMKSNMHKTRDLIKKRVNNFTNYVCIASQTASIISPVQCSREYRCSTTISVILVSITPQRLSLSRRDCSMHGRIVMINSRRTNHRDLHQKPSRSLRNYVIYIFLRTRLVHVDRY